jgi:hypothetical protein
MAEPRLELALDRLLGGLGMAPAKVLPHHGNTGIR